MHSFIGKRSIWGRWESMRSFQMRRILLQNWKQTAQWSTMIPMERANNIWKCLRPPPIIWRLARTSMPRSLKSLTRSGVSRMTPDRCQWRIREFSWGLDASRPTFTRTSCYQMRSLNWFSLQSSRLLKRTWLPKLKSNYSSYNKWTRSSKAAQGTSVTSSKNIRNKNSTQLNFKTT